MAIPDRIPPITPNATVLFQCDQSSLTRTSWVSIMTPPGIQEAGTTSTQPAWSGHSSAATPRRAASWEIMSPLAANSCCQLSSLPVYNAAIPRQVSSAWTVYLAGADTVLLAPLTNCGLTSSWPFVSWSIPKAITPARITRTTASAFFNLDPLPPATKSGTKNHVPPQDSSFEA